MNYIKGSSRNQTYFATLDEQVSADNSVRLIDVFFATTWASTSGEKRGVYYQDFYRLIIQAICVVGKNMIDSDTSLVEAQATAINLPTAAKNKLLKQVFGVVRTGTLFDRNYYEKIA